MKELKETLTKLFRAEPYSAEREKIYNKLKEIESKNNITTHHTYSQDNKTVKVEILKKNNGLYETIEIFTIDKIKVIDLTKNKKEV